MSAIKHLTEADMSLRAALDQFQAATRDERRLRTEHGRVIDRFHKETQEVVTAYLALPLGGSGEAVMGGFGEVDRIKRRLMAVTSDTFEAIQRAQEAEERLRVAISEHSAIRVRAIYEAEKAQ